MAGLIDYSQLIPVFPLPNVVLFPKAVVPLHVFEPRYRNMMADALRGNRLIAIALLRDGFESLYHTLEAPIHAVTCVGSVLKCEELCGGRYNLLLRGVERAEILHEDAEKSYRRANLQPIVPIAPAPHVECQLLSTLRQLVNSAPLNSIAEAANWKAILDCRDLALSDVSDLLAYSVFASCCEKQHFLAEPCVRKRACLLIKALESMGNRFERQHEARMRQGWPPPCCDN